MEEEIYIPSVLKEGYNDVNNVQPESYYALGKPLLAYLKDQIIINFPDDSFSFIETREEFRPTNYIQNPRNLITFFIEDSNKNPRVFVFDVTNCL